MANRAVRVYEHLCVNSVHPLDGVITSNNLQSVDTGKPVVINVTIHQAEDSVDTESDSESRESNTGSSEDETV